MAASQEGGAAVTVSLTEVSARDVHIQVDTAVRDEQFQRNRRQMLEKVRLIWIKGLLEPSLAHLACLELGLETQPDALERPFDLVVQRPKQAPQRLPPGTPISRIFDEAGKALLILGAPGAGKTTLLLELTRELLDRAAQDERHLIPVVFNLSSWAEQRLALADWLMDELHKRYDVPFKLAKAWMDDGLILPLLDGLDEVAAAHREACVEAINAFLREHGLLPLVVCSRVADYAALTGRLRLPSAVRVRPLSRRQVRQYVEPAGASLAGLRTVLQDDKRLGKLLTTPLMLSIAARAYQGRSADAIPSAGTADEHRAHLFAAYTEAMFQRRAKATPYTREQTERWLTWLARAMKRHNQSMFYLEWMQPDWLPGQRQQRLVTFITSVMSGLLGGLVTGLVYGLRDGLVFGLLGGLGVLLVGYSKEIKPVEKIRWSWSAAQDKWVNKLSKRLVGGLAGGLAIGLAIGLVLGLVYGLVGGLRDGLTVGEIGTQSFPNEGIKRSLRNALTIGLVLGLVGGLVFAPLGGLAVGLTVGLVFGLAFVLRFGGRACLYHFALRLVLWFNNFAPLHYIRFLDYCDARIFLRKTGGGYVFVHRMLLEYFAALHQASAEQHHGDRMEPSNFR